jgi:hypothetical protein
LQADNYFKVRCGKDSIEFPFVTDYASDAARAEAAARMAAAGLMGPNSVHVSVYDATNFPDYPQIGDWDPNDLRESDSPDSDVN